jgi:hypothetical protein
MMTKPSAMSRKIALISSAGIIAMAYALIPDVTARQAEKKSSPGATNQLRRDLQQLGEKIAKAVLDKDIPTLLGYDRADMRSEDEVALKNTKSDLYCFLFDSDCITWGNGEWRSVYDKLSQARQLGIKINTARSPYDHQLYGSLLFYDRSSVSEKDLRSSDFLCKQQSTQLASWNFRLEAGKWKPVTPCLIMRRTAFALSDSQLGSMRFSRRFKP